MSRMRAYGVPRTFGAECPDASDVVLFGLASHAGAVRGPGGEFRINPNVRKARRAARARWKRAARREGKVVW